MQGHEALDQQAGAGQQHDRERDLGDDEDSARASHSSPDHGPRASLLDGVDQIDLRGVERRNETEQQAGGERNDKGEREDASIDAAFGTADHVSRTQRHQRSRAPEGQQNTGSAGDERQQQALGDQLPDDPAPPGAERRANGDLARARRRLAQQQRGGVGTGDQQHHAHDTPQEVQREAHVAHELVLQTHGGHATPFVAVRVLLLEARGDRGQLGLRLFE